MKVVNTIYCSLFLLSTFQASLPASGATLLPKAISSQKLADKFHDHVVARVKDDWRYWDDSTVQCSLMEMKRVKYSFSISSRMTLLLSYLL